MYCPRCGVALPVPPPRFCASCGADQAPGAPLAAVARPGLVTGLAVLQFAGGALTAVVGLVLAGVAAISDDRSSGLVLGLVGGFLLAGAALQIVCGVGLLKLKPYGRTIQIVLAAIGLIAFPIGTVICVLILVYLMRPGIKLLFSGRPAADFTPDEHGQIAAVQGSRAAVVAVIAIAAVFAVIIGGSIVAAVAVPGLLRARISANEITATSRLRAMYAAQVAYASQNGGYYDSPRCLVAPADCLPGFSGDGFLEPRMMELTASGYRFSFVAGVPATSVVESSLAAPRSPTSLVTYAFIAEPEVFGTTGMRAFCGDSTGQVCAVAAPSVDAAGGQCPASCSPVR